MAKSILKMLPVIKSTINVEIKVTIIKEKTWRLVAPCSSRSMTMVTPKKARDETPKSLWERKSRIKPEIKAVCKAFLGALIIPQANTINSTKLSGTIVVSRKANKTMTV